MAHTRRWLLVSASALVGVRSLMAAPRVFAAPAPDSHDRRAALARDVDRVESVRAVKRLQHAWSQYVDLGMWDEAGRLFDADARLSHADEQFNSRSEISAALRNRIGKGVDGLPEHVLHTPLLLAPIVTLSDDGDHARGRWHIVMLSGALGDDAGWEMGILECAYVRRDGAWKISEQTYALMGQGPYESGWLPTRPELPLVPYHFLPSDVGKPFPLGVAVPVASTSSVPPPLPAIAGRIQALRDEVEVRNLQNALGYYLDWKMWDDVIDLFAPGGSIAIAGVGTYSGAGSIRRYLEWSGPAGLRNGEVNDHVQTDMVIEVAPDGLHARGRGVVLGMLGRDNKDAWWTLTRFDNSYVKQGGIWRVGGVRTAQWMMTDYFRGWGKDWQSQPQPPAEHRPDGPAPAALPSVWALDRTPPAPRPTGGMTLLQAEQALHAAAGVDSIENLAGGYGTYIDDNQWEELASLFAAQGERDSAGGGFIRTPARIASFSRARYGPYNPHRAGTQMHMRTQPVIHVSADGMTGQSRTRLFQTAVVPLSANSATGQRGGPMFTTGIYEDDIVFEDGAWKNKRADIDHLIYAPYKTGWTHVPDNRGKDATPSMGKVAGQKFDAYNTGDINPAFPRVAHMWFHYRNPVSGRVPQYLMPKYILPEP